MVSFGKFVKESRLDLRIGLREFCEKINQDPSYWSKIERGLSNPPIDEQTLSRIAEALQIADNLEQRQHLIDLAYLSRREIAPEFSSDEKLMKMLPAFLRTVTNKKPQEEILDRLTALIKEYYKSEDHHR